MPNSDDGGPGTESAPLRTIGEAIRRAEPGDQILVAPGVYRELIAPVRSGELGRPIVIRSLVPAGAVIRGSEILHAELLAPGVHRLPIPPSLVADRNPFALPLAGSRIGGTCGQVFLGSHALREVRGQVLVAQRPGTWSAKEDGTVIVLNVPETWAPGVLEISVRDRLFAPVERGTGHLRVEGFVFERCANDSAAAFWEPHRRQCGAVGLRAGHHIEFVGNEIRDVKTIGMDVGDEGGLDKTDDLQPHDNLIERNYIHDCGEVGICGRNSLRTVVRGNVIERNGCLSLHTVEEAGLKFHQFYEGLIEANVIRDNEAMGIWLDAVWTDARVTRNLVVNNVGAGIFIELGSDACTVDHNVVANTRQGDGIYSHDASDVLVAHNLVFGNAHFGIYMRYVTDRPFPHRDGITRPAECSRNRVVHNLFIDNYRGHLCLPAQGPRSKGNQSDGNHFINGTQWQWEGQSFHRFCLGDNDGSIPADEVMRQLSEVGVTPEQIREAASLNLSQWRALGYDLSSHAPSAFRITHENGAVVKGTATIGVRDAFLELRLSEDAAAPPVTTLDQFPTDFLGRARSQTTAPGPFADLGPGHHVLDVTPTLLP